MRRKLVSLLLLTTFLIFHFLPQEPSFFSKKSYAEEQKNLQVTAVVPAQPSDFTTTTELIDPAPASSYPQSTVLTYQVTYGSTLSTPVNFTLEANWSLGTISGSGSPTVDIVDYVVGSASNAYGSAPPVIDSVNRKITWTISTFPANTTNQTVTFQLITNSNYTGPATIDFDISSLIHGPGVDSSTSTITDTYQYTAPVTPTPTPTSAPGPSSSPGPSTPTPTPTPTAPFAINTINVTGKTATTATIAVTTNQNAGVTILYGTRITALNQSATSNNFGTYNTVSLTDLTPETTYFFVVRATNSAGQLVASDIYTFTTAKVSELPTINLETLIATSQDKVILDGAVASRLGSSTIIAPKNFTIEVRFAVNKDARLKRIVLNVRPKNVLGANTFTNIEPPETGSSLIEIQRGIFYGRLKAGHVGLFELFAQIEDENGNIIEQRVADVRVLEPMKIISARTKLPIEGARVTLSFFNIQNNKFEFISPTSLAIKNPSFSGTDGIVSIVLPPGRYQATVQSLGYKKQNVEFVIGLGANEKYPLIELQGGSLTFGGLIEYISNTFSDIFSFIGITFGALSLSMRLALLLNILTLLFFIVLLLLALSLHYSISPFLLPRYLYYHATFFLKRKGDSHLLKGVVVNKEDGHGIEGVLVYIHAGKNKIIAHTVTNAFGEFYVKVVKSSSYIISTIHQSFTPSELYSVVSSKIGETQKIYVEPKRHNIISRFIHQAGWYSGYLLSELTELLLVVTLILEVLFLINLEFITTIPFVLLAACNVALLLYFRKHKEEVKSS